LHPRTIAVKYQSGQKRCCRLRRQPGKKERNSMLIVALQDDVDNLYAIWNTVSDRFLGVNLGKYEAVGIIMDYKEKCTFEDALSRVEHPQPFCDITKCICDELKLCNNYSKSKEWFLAEIEMTREKIKAYAECFDGVIVDNKTRIELCKSHIRFCENAIKQLN